MKLVHWFCEIFGQFNVQHTKLYFALFILSKKVEFISLENKKQIESILYSLQGVYLPI